MIQVCVCAFPSLTHLGTTTHTCPFLKQESIWLCEYFCLSSERKYSTNGSSLAFYMNKSTIVCMLKYMDTVLCMCDACICVHAHMYNVVCTYVCVFEWVCVCISTHISIDYCSIPVDNWHFLCTHGTCFWYVDKLLQWTFAQLYFAFSGCSPTSTRGVTDSYSRISPYSLCCRTAYSSSTLWWMETVHEKYNSFWMQPRFMTLVLIMIKEN